MARPLRPIRPTCLRSLSRPVPRPVLRSRRPLSSPVRVTRPQDVRRWHASARRFLTNPDLLQPCAYGGARGDTLQLATEELLHGLALERGARRELVADLLRNSPYGNLNSHDRIMPAFGNRRSPVRLFLCRGGWCIMAASLANGDGGAYPQRPGVSEASDVLLTMRSRERGRHQVLRRVRRASAGGWAGAGALPSPRGCRRV